MNEAVTAEKKQKNQKSYILSRLGELKNFFTRRNAASSQTAVIDPLLFSEKFLTRAPGALLESLSTEDLAGITEEAMSVLAEISKDPSSTVVKVSQITTGVFFALKDRPFIVSTIVEAARGRNISISALLHPIVAVQGTNYSLNFLYIEDATPQEIEVLTKEIDLALIACKQTADDYNAMKTVLERYRQLSTNPSFIKRFATSDNQEVKQFIDWLLDESFIFMGTIEHTLSDGAEINGQKNLLGILSGNAGNTQIAEKIISECKEDIRLFSSLSEPLWLSKLSVLSDVHRRVRLSHLYIAATDDAGQITSVLSIVGIFSSKAFSQEGASIPLIRTKLRSLLESDELVSGSHDYKFIGDIINRMPKEEAIRLNREGLRDIVDQTIDVYTRNDSQVSVRFDASKRGASVLVVLPLEWFSETTRLDIEQSIQKFFSVTTQETECYIDTSAHGLARLYYHVTFSFCPTQAFEVSVLNQTIKDLSENFGSRILKLAKGKSFAAPLSAYIKNFDEEYQTIHSAAQALRDIEIFNQLSPQKPVRVALQTTDSGSSRLDFYFQDKDRTLSTLLPVLEHAGFSVMKDTSLAVPQPGGSTVFIHRFEVTAASGSPISAEYFHGSVGAGLEEIFAGYAEDDVLTSLMLTAGLTNRQILMLRAYTSHLWQFNIFPRKHQIREALAAHPIAAISLWKFFEARFDPAFVGDRSQCQATYRTQFEDEIRKEKDIAKDRTLRAMIKLVAASLRTNFYQGGSTLATKIDPRALDFVPEPKPWREIFVHSYTIEGVHLRTGPVSRGGLRWSERPDDFRTEVLGLVKTQKVKNVFIVPEGAKGGFVVRDLPTTEVFAAVKNAYSEFIRALLTLADNREQEAIIPPTSVIRYDGDDPYFVVAADKGTATFSDTANGIAVNESHFWLDDAFASGGSNGYDHKIYGITAKGAWECVLRHFNDLGIDYLHDTFTAVGIGDMAGDVFGNGLILSDNVKLLAAFNHKHIFLDPNPDTKKSFAERTRLFQNPKLQWNDYNPELISAGGGVFDRNEKEIKISDAIKTALGFTSTGNTFSGEEIINAILKAPVDLLWNGGIGTYVKATTETNTQVNDGANDRVRVSADELRCKVVGEGGNLGFTQRARVEFSSLGGRINTDAIDNSGGVGLSDHEVNLKILFSGLMKSKKVTREERNEILKSMADEVCEQVLEHNRAHAYRLTMSSKRSVIQHEFFRGFISNMQQMGYLNRTLDALPQDDEIYRRLTVKQGLYRPELAVCLAATKMWIKNLVVSSEIIKSPALEKFLINYFPKTLQGKFLDAIKAHPLRESIIATQVTNELVDIFGISFFYRLLNSGSFTTDSVLTSLLSTLIILDAPTIIKDLQKLDKPGISEHYLELRSRFEQGLRSVASWFAYRATGAETIANLVAQYGPAFKTCLTDLGASTPVKLPAEASLLSVETVAILKGMLRASEALELYGLSISEKIPVTQAFELVLELKTLIGLAGHENVKNQIIAANRWEYSLRRSSLADIDRALMRIVSVAVKQKATTPAQLKTLLQESPSFQPLVHSINELTNIAPSVAHLAVIARQFRDFVL